MVKMTGQGKRKKRDSNKTKHSNRGNVTRICTICTGPATGRNFGVVACDACAAFFRKSIVTDRHYKCRREMNCEFNKARRNCCRFCRMAKCHRVGMRKDLVQKTQSSSAIEEQQKNSNMDRICESKSPHPSTTRIDEEDATILEILSVIEKQLLRPTRSSNPTTGGIFSIAATEASIEHFLLNDKMDGAGGGDVYSSVKSGKGLKEIFNWDVNREEENKLDGNSKEADKYLPEPNACWEVDQLLCAIIAKCMPSWRKLSQVDRLCLFRYIKWPAMFMLTSFYSQLESANELMTSAGISPWLEFQTARYNWDFRLQKMAEQVYGASNLLSAWKRIFPSNKEFIFLLALLFSHVATPGLSVEGRQVLSAETSKLSGELVRFEQDALGHWAGPCRYMEIMDLITGCFEAAHCQERLDTHIEIFHRLPNTTTTTAITTMVNPSCCQQKPYQYNNEERSPQANGRQKCSTINLTTTTFYDLDEKTNAISPTKNNKAWTEYGGVQEGVVFERNDAAMLLEEEKRGAASPEAHWMAWIMDENGSRAGNLDQQASWNWSTNQQQQGDWTNWIC